MIEFNGDIVQFYKYRTAVVLASFSVELTKCQFELLKIYIESNGYRMDNHICWKNDDGLYFGYSDHKLYVGHEVTKGIY